MIIRDKRAHVNTLACMQMHTKKCRHVNKEGEYHQYILRSAEGEVGNHSHCLVGNPDSVHSNRVETFGSVKRKNLRNASKFDRDF